MSGQSIEKYKAVNSLIIEISKDGQTKTNPAMVQALAELVNATSTMQSF
ncbi:hypothetical protein JOC36_000850 [Weissella uvarum]|nr:MULTISPECIES: hypothetical protein [Bacilli]MBM7617301.1 hypothetical protein [Weissella uvarum]MCM0595199.1 hypothetical protein [Weissella uvarum]MDA5649545.1 hypothetical protein [Staphylococcus aureus]MDA5653796.1 hypothetical protein [Staphylococcus aureus]